MTALPDLLQIAREAIGIAAGQAQPHHAGAITAKGDRDMATAADFAIERRIRGFLAHHTPQIGFLGEEDGGTLAAGRTWVLDPIDGTANFLRAMPLHGISLALVQDGHAVAGVIAAPALHRTYWAARGLGAWRDGTRITTSTVSTLVAAMVAVGDYGTGPGAMARNQLALAVHQRLAATAQRVRMLGSAAIDLAWVADGTLDASITLGNTCWDMAAGVIIAQEAGAQVTDIDGAAHNLSSAMTIAAPPSLSPLLLDLLAAATTDCPHPAPDPAAAHDTAGGSPC
jgi:myo-inositol-1(or 4)-monophosphatase